MKNIATKQDNQDVLPADAFNSMCSEMKNLATDSGQVLDATSETTPDPSPIQISKAVTQAALSAPFYDDSGSANTYILTTPATWRQPSTYINGSIFRFAPDVTNTGASTVTIAGIGAKAIVHNDGVALAAGSLIVGKQAAIMYDSPNDRFILLGVPRVLQATIASQTGTATDTDLSGASLSLTPGRWEVSYSVSTQIAVGTGTPAAVAARTKITNSSNVDVPKTQRVSYISAATGTSLSDTSEATVIIDVAATTTYKIRIQSIQVTGSGGSATWYNSPGNPQYAESIFMAKQVLGL